MTKAQAQLCVKEFMARKWFLLTHVEQGSDYYDCEETVNLGVYSSREAAVEAMERRRNQEQSNGSLGCYNHDGGHLYPDEWNNLRPVPKGKPSGNNSPKKYDEYNYFQITEVDLNKDWF